MTKMPPKISPQIGKDEVVQYALKMNTVHYAIENIIAVIQKDSLNKDFWDDAELFTPSNIDGLLRAIKMLSNSAYNQGCDVIKKVDHAINDETILF